MIRKLKLLLGVSIIILGLSCSNYVQAKDITAKSSLELALADEKSKSFIKNNRKEIEQIRKEYEQIQIVIEGTGEIPYLAYKGRKQYGVYPQLIDLVSGLTKVPCVVNNTKESLEDNYDCIINREADLVFGITLPAAIASSDKTSMELEERGMRLTKLNGSVFTNSLILAVPSKENYTKEQIPYAFWGATMEYDSTVMETMLADHTIDYNTYAEMKAAFCKNEIQGMFIPESKLEYEVQINKEAYHGLNFSRVKANEYFVDLSSSNRLSKLVGQISALYDQLYTEYFDKDNQWMYMTSDQDRIFTVKMVKIAVSIGLLIATVGIIAVFAIRIHTRRQFEKMILLVPKNESKWEDILFVNLRNHKMQSKLGFSFYGLSSRIRKKKLPMKEMTKRIGFDFTKYYEYIIARHKTEFVHEFELYIQGVQYHYVENGVVQGKKIASRIYRK